MSCGRQDGEYKEEVVPIARLFFCVRRLPSPTVSTPSRYEDRQTCLLPSPSQITSPSRCCCQHSSSSLSPLPPSQHSHPASLSAKPPPSSKRPTACSSKPPCPNSKPPAPPKIHLNCTLSSLIHSFLPLFLSPKRPSPSLSPPKTLPTNPPLPSDWSSNGCTASPDNPLGFDFLQSCQRHDFGYRNYKAQSRFSDDAKARIDDNFHDDMDNQCATEDGDVKRGLCEGVATLYYEAVKAFGSKRRGVEMEVGGVVFRE